MGYGLNQVTIVNPFATQDQITNTTVAQVGKPYGELQTTDWLRSPSGQIIVDPTTGYPTLNSTPQLFGTTVPPTKVGITTSISYKGFTLNAVADGRFGAVLFNGIGPALDFTGVSGYSVSSGRQRPLGSALASVGGPRPRRGQAGRRAAGPTYGPLGPRFGRTGAAGMWGCSSAGQSNWFATSRSRVRIPSAPLTCRRRVEDVEVCHMLATNRPESCTQ